MRQSRVLAVMILVGLLVATPNVFAKVCHPKKPITCSAAAFSNLGTLTTAVPAATPKATSVKAKSPVKVQHAMICGPWVHYHCMGNPLV